jgi:hypothetical protein
MILRCLRKLQIGMRSETERPVSGGYLLPYYRQQRALRRGLELAEKASGKERGRCGFYPCGVPFFSDDRFPELTACFRTAISNNIAVLNYIAGSFGSERESKSRFSCSFQGLIDTGQIWIRGQRTF